MRQERLTVDIVPFQFVCAWGAPWDHGVQLRDHFRRPTNERCAGVDRSLGQFTWDLQRQTLH